MSESLNPEWPESALPQAGASLPMTAGQMIRTARVQMGMHLAVLSVNLKVPIRQLEALEADEHDQTKGPVFVRALASSVCRHLHIDPAPVLALLPQSTDRMLLPKPTLLEIDAARRVPWNLQNVLRAIQMQTVLIAAAMLMLIAALLWLPSPSTWGWLQPAIKAEPVTQAAPVLPPLTVVSEPVLSDAATAAQTAAVISTPVAPPVPTASVPLVAVPATQAPAIAQTPVTPTSKLAVANTAPGAVMVFTATNDSWIEIRDGKNQVLWSRVVNAGQSAQVQFPPPMNVVIGRAHVVSVTYKGQPFDLSPHTKSTVARFEVKE